MEKSKAKAVLPWLRGIVAVCMAFLSIIFAVQGEWLKAVACAMIAVGDALLIRSK